MKTLKGAEALEFHKKLKERNEALHASDIASALVHADAVGKERFDLEELEKLCDTSNAGRLTDVKERRDIYERMYYVEYPKIMKLKEFARIVETLSSWS